VPWKIFEPEAPRYEAWYATRRGRRADRAERALLDWLLGQFPGGRSVLDVGCGSGHFSDWLARRGLTVVGLDRTPTLLAEMQKRYPRVPVVLGDAHRLPFRKGAVDLALFVTTLEFLEDPQAALFQGVNVARQGVIVVALNRWSLGGLSRRCGREARHAILGQARDFPLASLVSMVKKAAAERWRDTRWASTLFPDGFWNVRTPIPLGDVIGMAVLLAPPPASA
jgi:SAM-dependent methyltransferase